MFGFLKCLRHCSKLRLNNLRLFCNKSLRDPYEQLYNENSYSGIPEISQFKSLVSQISSKSCLQLEHIKYSSISEVGLSKADFLLLFDAALITHCLHIQSRISYFDSIGYYTIGCCGEETLGPIGLLLNSNDPVALHYRHLSAQIARLLKRERNEESILNNEFISFDIIDNLILNRARGYTISKLDPVTAGKHCSIGGDHNYDYLVTSTLSSQTTPAVGRALGGKLFQQLKLDKNIYNSKFDKNFVSFVSVGDGSINNSHFLSGVNLSEYALYNNIKCPILFGISNNNICISLKDNVNWCNINLNKYLINKFKCNGNDILDIYYNLNNSINYVRKYNKPALIIFNNTSRQFGHAATDRQDQYYTGEEINAKLEYNIISILANEAVRLNVLTYDEILKRLFEISNSCKNNFELTSKEAKWETKDRNEMILTNSQNIVNFKLDDKNKVNISGLTKKNFMRKLMNAAIQEALQLYDNCVYIGEDVRHGGYYLVTEGLAKKYNLRICDFPPDETSIMGCSIGYSHSGLLPIVEMPYAKYLDCASDMFFESIIMNWLSNNKQPNGIYIRLQGFGNGLFGGNFHTHNMIYLPPGLDVVCYSNGSDYIRGFRYNIQQVKNGRIVMSIDCTKLLTMRHIYDDLKDNGMMLPYPEINEYLKFDDIILYPMENNLNDYFKSKIILTDRDNNYINNLNITEDNLKYSNNLILDNFINSNDKNIFIIITYGLGVVLSRQAQLQLYKINNKLYNNVIIIDTPYLSDIPLQLKTFLMNDNIKYKNKNISIIFADICKESQAPLNNFIIKLQNNNILNNYNWKLISALNTYNPLGKEITFLNKDDIINCIQNM